MRTLLLCLACCGIVFASSAPPPTTDVTVTSSTHSVHSGFTRSLSVQCKFSHHQESPVQAVTSLILAKTDRTDSSEFIDIATITVATPEVVEVKDDLGSNVTGSLSVNGSSSIAYEWSYPDHHVQGRYRCTAHGLNSLGHPAVTSAVTEVEEQSADLTMVLRKLRSLETDHLALSERLINATEQLADAMTELGDTRARLTAADKQLSENTGELVSVKTQLTTTAAELSQTRSQLQTSQTYEISHEVMQLRRDQEKAKVIFSATGPLTGNVETGQTVVFGRVLTSVGGGYDNTSGVFTAPVAGYYMASVHVVSQQDEKILLYIQHNEQNVVNVYAVANNDMQSGSNSAALRLQPGDQVKVAAYINSYLFVGLDCTFSMYLVTLE